MRVLGVALVVALSTTVILQDSLTAEAGEMARSNQRKVTGKSSRILRGDVSSFATQAGRFTTRV